MNDTDKSKFESVPSDIILGIIDFNTDGQELVKIKSLNKTFYELLNPNISAVNKLWENITRQKFPQIPYKLRCKRWDLYFKYRLNKTTGYRPNDGIIENCDYDINEINDQYNVKIIGNKIYKTQFNESNNNDKFSENEVFKGEIGSNGLPKGFDGRLRCPMVMRGNWNFLDLKDSKQGIYNCQTCKKDVYTVTTLDELNLKLKQNKCIRIAYYTVTPISKTEKQRIREDKRIINRSIREIHRKLNRIKREIKKCQMGMKRLGKQGQMQAVKATAKDVIKMKDIQTKCVKLKSEIRSWWVQMDNMAPALQLQRAMQNVAKALSSISNEIKLPELQALFRKYEIQSDQMEMKQDMIEDVLDCGLNGDSEAEEELIQSLMKEIGLDLRSNGDIGVTQVEIYGGIGGDRDDTDDDNLSERLARLAAD